MNDTKNAGIWHHVCAVVTLAIIAAGTVVGFKRCTAPDKMPKEVLLSAPGMYDGMEVCVAKSGARAWRDLGWMRTYDSYLDSNEKEKAAQELTAAEEALQYIDVPAGAPGVVVRRMAAPRVTPSGKIYYVQVRFFGQYHYWVHDRCLISR
jgi:hypothetical protein